MDYEIFIKKNILNIKIKEQGKKFKDIKINLDNEEIEKENYKKYNYEISKEKNDYILKIKKDKKVILEKKINPILLNVKYYLTKGPFNYRINKNPFYSYIEKNNFNIEAIQELLEREKINNIDIIKIKRQGKNNFEKMIGNKNYEIDKFEIIFFEFHFKEKEVKINKYNNYNDDLKILKNKVEKYLEKAGKYDLIYLYASPLFDELGKSSELQKISYRDEIKIILNLLKKSKKEFNCLFECASDKVLKDVLSLKKTKILHISSHGKLDNRKGKENNNNILENKDQEIINKQYNFNLILENLEKCGEKQTIKQDTLETYLTSYSSKIKKIDLIILTICYSGCFFDLILKYCKPNNVIYIDKNSEINDIVCVRFTEYFYSELINGNSIRQSYDKAISRLISEKDRLSKIMDGSVEDEINKIMLYESEKKLINLINLFESNNIGELKTNKNVIKNFDSKKYISIIGRTNKIKKVLEDLKNKKNQFLIIYSKSTDKLSFAESLCVYLFERKKIDGYKMFNELENFRDYINYIESEIKKYKQNCNLTINKIIVIKIKEEEQILKIKEKFNKYKQFYFIILIDIDKLGDNIINNCECYDDKLAQNEAENLFKEICKNYGKKYKNNKLQFFSKKTYYNPKEVEKYFDKMYNILDKSMIVKDNENDNIINFSLNPLCNYLFILSKMPSGLPDSFVNIIFKENFISNLINKNLTNNWNFMNTDIFGNKNEILIDEKLEKYYIKYMLKMLGLYCKLLYYNIEQNRNEIIYQDEKIHFVFNSYNNEGIWKCNIPNIKDEINININNIKTNEDFNIKNHTENIYNLIKYLVNKLKYFDEQYIYIEYLSEILLLFPSYFFRKKICKYYLMRCKEFCDTCQNYFLMKSNNKKNIQENKLNVQINIVNNNIDNFGLKLNLEIINKQIEELKNQREKFKNNYEKWKEKNIIVRPEIKFVNQNSKLSLFLYSISSDSELLNEQNLKDNLELNNQNSELYLELKIILFLKNAHAESSKNILNDIFNIFKDNNKLLPTKRKAKLIYELACKYYEVKNVNESKKYLNEALKYSNGDIFLHHRIELDLCYIFLREFNAKKEDINLYTEIKKKISVLEELEKNQNNKLYNEGYYLSKILFKLIKPNIIILNANPLKSNFNEIFAYPNNHYYILNELDELSKEKKIKSDIKLKSDILNEENLNKVLGKNGDILIIQSDDFNKDGDIFLESDYGESQRLEKNKILSHLNKQKKAEFKIIILCFINSIKFVEFIKDKMKFKYLIYFNDLNILKYKKSLIEYNRFCIDFIIEFISGYNDKDISDNFIFNTISNFNKKLEINNLIDFPKCGFIKKENNYIKISSKTNKIKEGILFLEPFLYLQISNNLKKKINIDENWNFSNEMVKIIKDIKNGNNQAFFCNNEQKEKYLKIGFEIIKYFYRHKTFKQYYTIDIESNLEIQLIKEENTDKNIFRKREKNEYFYLIYSCKYDSSITVLNYLLENNYSYMFIYNDDKTYLYNE